MDFNVEMELRVLRYFLMVAKEQSFTKAAEQLHITQPTLSRQLAALEEELGSCLFHRGGHGITLTDEGLLLKRRALELLDLEDKIVEEFKGTDEVIEGTITIGCGEFAAVEPLAQMCKQFREKYPRVQIALHTGTADVISDMMNKGLVDIGMFLEPVSTEGMDYVRIPESDHWAGVMAMQGLGYPISIEGAAKYWRKDLIIQKPLHPEIVANTVIAWKLLLQQEY